MARTARTKNPVNEARRLARERAAQRLAEHTRRIGKHVEAIAELKAEAEAFDQEAELAAAELRQQAKDRRDQVLPHLAALLEMGQRPADIAALCDVPRSLVTAARKEAQPTASSSGAAAQQGPADGPSPAGPSAAPTPGPAPGGAPAEV